jgi:hypothetical protein
MDYKTVINKIVEKQKETIGAIAVQRSKAIDKIEVEDGEITFSEDPGKEDVEALMEEYKKIQGQGAVGIARKGMSEILEDDMDIELPEEIIPKDVKKDKFAEAL